MSHEPVPAAAVSLGVVSFLNARPLIEGLEGEPGLTIRYEVPSRLPPLLRHREVDAALVPAVDWARAGGAWQLVSDACIAGDGETLTVRVFSRVRPADVDVLHTDGDSHTSVALARLIWTHRFGRAVTMRPLDPAGGPDACEAVLLIGDKVITRRPQGFAHELDLGQAWKDWTGLPFVFAVWAAEAGRDCGALARRLSAARDRGVADARRLARQHGPARGWPLAIAEAYLTRHMRYVLTPESGKGLERFVALADEAGLLADPEHRAAPPLCMER